MSYRALTLAFAALLALLVPVIAHADPPALPPRPAAPSARASRSW